MAMHPNSKSAMDEAKENAAAVKTVIRWVQENLSRDDVSALIAGLGGARDAETMPLIKSYPYGAADRDDAAAEIVELLRAKLDEADFAKIAPLVDDVLASVSAKSGLGPDVDWPVIDEDNRAGGHFGGLRGKGSLGINPHGSGAMDSAAANSYAKMFPDAARIAPDYTCVSPPVRRGSFSRADRIAQDAANAAKSYELMFPEAARIEIDHRSARTVVG